MTKPLPTLLALMLAAINVSLVVGALALHWLNGSHSTYESPWADLLPALSFSLVAALVLAHRPNHVIGWLLLLIGFLTNPEIAERLVISQKTVLNQVSNILSKLQVVDRAQVIIRARAAGLGV